MPGEKLKWTMEWIESDCVTPSCDLIFPFYKKTIVRRFTPYVGGWGYGFVDLGNRKYVFGEIYPAGGLVSDGTIDMGGYTCEGFIEIPENIGIFQLWREIRVQLNICLNSGIKLPTKPEFGNTHPHVCVWMSEDGINFTFRKSRNRKSVEEIIGRLNTDIPEKQFIKDVLAQLAFVLSEYENDC